MGKVDGGGRPGILLGTWESPAHAISSANISASGWMRIRLIIPRHSSTLRSCLERLYARMTYKAVNVKTMNNEHECKLKQFCSVLQIVWYHLHKSWTIGISVESITVTVYIELIRRYISHSPVFHLVENCRYCEPSSAFAKSGNNRIETCNIRASAIRW